MAIELIKCDALDSDVIAAIARENANVVGVKLTCGSVASKGNKSEKRVNHKTYEYSTMN
jgi:hypothetical protein